MAKGDLEEPRSTDDLYLARGEEVYEARPLLTGDVFSGVAIPGLDDGLGLAAIVTHPCTMRPDGTNIGPKLLCARVAPQQNITTDTWKRNGKVMPLPSLLGDNADHAVRLDEVGLVPREQILASTRIACLSPAGINLLQQRYIWRLSRFHAETKRLNEASAGVFAEIELHADWVEERTSAVGQQAAVEEFTAWIRDVGNDGKTTRQDQLFDAQQRAGIRIAMRQALRALE